MRHQDPEPRDATLSAAVGDPCRTCTDALGIRFGFDFHRTFSAKLEGLDWHFGDYFDDAGTVTARFSIAAGLPHEVTMTQAPLVWDFIRHFSRDPETGESRYAPVALGGARLAADAS